MKIIMLLLSIGFSGRGRVKVKVSLLMMCVSDRDLRADNITVNLWVVNERWLFSLLWCAGAISVTTNSCHLLKDVEQPDWFMVSSTSIYSSSQSVERVISWEFIKWFSLNASQFSLKMLPQ